MSRIQIVLVVGLAVTALTVAGCGGGDNESAGGTDTTATETTETSEAAGHALVGTVGSTDDPEAFVITLTAEDGSEVTTLTPGEYTLDISDLATTHNFHLSGAGVDVSTSVSETGDQQQSITLEAGTYNFVCDPHASSMNGSFEVSG